MIRTDCGCCTVGVREICRLSELIINYDAVTVVLGGGGRYPVFVLSRGAASILYRKRGGGGGYYANGRRGDKP